ncbi:HAD family hydrolase [Umboniibacter marinipuniceus]|uniref:HAD superfamily hydrolase (TIGR01509 family) n=1 Tax=Umboniibacter marinipuniceus TaxID=569599 RepID=A0A3M0A4F7_9GAMM|nr:HAD-IA family hydrolase [Umboniibacter marinipuniceus]RMA80061.1 HAD superfamily hydrolase (TIGR01509 family) [Umboniibacter marinipuniceus]
MDNIELLIFDCDGVLVDTENVANNVLHRHLSLHNWPLAPTATEQFFRGRSLTESLRRAVNEFQLTLPADFLQVMQRDTFEQFRQVNLSFPNCKVLVQQLSACAFPMCVASSGSHEKIALTLSQTGLLGYFPIRFSAQDVTRAKPAPDLFLKASSYFCTPPERCLVIEDSSAGLAAADAAGMPSIGLNTQLSAAQQRDFPNTLFLQDHAALLRWMNGH